MLTHSLELVFLLTADGAAGASGRGDHAGVPAAHVGPGQVGAVGGGGAGDVEVVVAELLRERRRRRRHQRVVRAANIVL